MRHLIVCDRDGAFQKDVPESQISDILASDQRLLWLDIRDPDESDVALLRDEFGFHPLAIEDVLHDTQRPKVDSYDGYYLLVFYAARYDETTDEIELQELDLFVGRNYLVSVHDGRLLQVSETIDRWRTPNSPIGKRVAVLLYALLDAIVDDYFPLADSIGDRIDEIEDQIFLRFDEQTIQTIFRLKKELLQLRRALAPERDVLNVLLRREIPVFEPGDTVYLQDVYDHIVRVTDSIDTYRELLSSALDSFLSVQSNQLNQVVKILTIGSIILMVNSLIAGIYGMNFDSMPELHWRFGYPFALGLMVALSGGLIWLFRRMRWL